MNDRMKEDYKNNKPKLFLPILSVVISVICITAISIFYAGGAIKSSYFGIFLTILILYPVGSFYVSYFSKKVNIKKLKQYEIEIDLMTKFAKKFSSFTAISCKEGFLKTTFEEKKQIKPAVKFNLKKCAFSDFSEDEPIIIFGVSFMGFTINPKSGALKDLVGLIPTSIWRKKRLKEPTQYVDGNIYLVLDQVNINKKFCLKVLEKADILYDKKTGWFLIGERHVTAIDDYVRVNENTIIGIRDQEIISLWIKLDSKMPI